MTTKGDLLSRSASALGRLPVSTNNFSLLCDSAQALGIKWGASATSTLTTAGDLLYASGANTLARLAKGTDNQVLKMNGTSLNWETLPVAGGKLELIEAVELGSANNKIISTVSVNTALYSKILIEWEVSQSATTATAIGFRVNANTGSSQLVQGYEQNGATQTTFGTTTTYMEINPSIGWSTNESLDGSISVFCPTGTTSGSKRLYFGGFCQTYFEATGKNRVFGMVNSHNDTATHATYEIFCVEGAVTFKAGTWMNVYGIEKA